MGGFRSLAFGLAAGAAAAVAGSPAAAQCRLCDKPSTLPVTGDAERHVTLQLETSINFDRIVVSGAGDGSAILRPDGGIAAQGTIAQVSPRAMVGSVVVQGQPGKAVRVLLPARVVLNSLAGGQITLDDVVTDLPSLPRLDSNGRLSFRFGGRLRVQGDAEGQYRGELPITAEYL
jgi:hypothetical protein